MSHASLLSPVIPASFTPIRRHTMRASREQIQHEALSRAASGQSLANWPTILAGFTAKGIPESDVRPRENVFTYHAWRALGRQVPRAHHGGQGAPVVDTDPEAPD